MTVSTTDVFYSSAVYTTMTQFWNAHQYSSDNRPPPIVYPTLSPPATTTSSITPSYLAQYLPSRLTSACSCLAYPTVTKAGTQTITVARTSSVVSPPSPSLPAAPRPNPLSPHSNQKLTLSNKPVLHRHLHLLSPHNRHLRRSLRPLGNHEPTTPHRNAHPARPHSPPHPRPRPKNHPHRPHPPPHPHPRPYNHSGQCRLVYGIDNVVPQETPYAQVPDTCPNGATKVGFGSRAGVDATDVYVPGLCAAELYAGFQSSRAFGGSVCG